MLKKEKWKEKWKGKEKEKWKEKEKEKWSNAWGRNYIIVPLQRAQKS